MSLKCEHGKIESDSVLPSHYEYDPAKWMLRDSPRRGYANDSIVRELEKIPEPIQLSLLDFIRSLGSSYTATNQSEPRSVGSNDLDPPRKRRTTSAIIAGKGKTLGDIVSPSVDEQDWECLK